MKTFDIMNERCTIIQRVVRDIITEKQFDKMWFRVDPNYNNIVISYNGVAIWAYDLFSVSTHEACYDVGYTIARAIKFLG